MKPFEERKGTDHELDAVLNRLRGPMFGDQRRHGPPGSRRRRFPGSGQFGGFEFQVLDEGGTDIGALANATYGLVGAGNKSRRVTGLFSSFTANDPQLSVDIDRERALALGLPIGEITSALQIYLGSQYVNDFDFNNRAYRVYVQADQTFRSDPQALKQLYVRTREGQMVPLGNVVRMNETTAPAGHQPLQPVPVGDDQRHSGARLQLRAGAPGNGAARGETLPAGMNFAWSGLSLEESKAGRQSFIIFGLGLLLVYLTLAAQYESLVLPFIVLLGVPLAVLGALTAAVAARLRQRRLLPDRAARAGRAGGQELDPDRRVRGAAAGARDVDRRKPRSRRRAFVFGRS